MSLPNQINRTVEQINKSLYPAHSHLKLSQAEPIIGDSTWRSPGTYVTGIDLPENFDYTGGSLKYVGLVDIEVILHSTVTMSAASAGVSIEMTGGKNGTPDLDYVIAHKLTNANDEKELSMNYVVTMSTNDTLDFFVKASSNISLDNAVWIIHNNS